MDKDDFFNSIFVLNFKTVALKKNLFIEMAYCNEIEYSYVFLFFL
jgi:hypothetical protein